MVYIIYYWKKAVENFHTCGKNKMVYQEKTAFFYAFDFVNKIIIHFIRSSKWRHLHSARSQNENEIFIHGNAFYKDVTENVYL